ncbi:MAG: cupin domain-containing protein [Gemmatimonadota bacterium]|jgi:quercetin dioxygenase-like cupin family protein
MPETSSLSSGPRDLTDLIDYQEGAVVSRTLLKTPGGTLTLFAFAEGQGLSEHSTPHEAYILVLHGSARVTVGGTEHTVETGQALALPATVAHALTAEEPFKMLLTMLRQPTS